MTPIHAAIALCYLNVAAGLAGLAQAQPQPQAPPFQQAPFQRAPPPPADTITVSARLESCMWPVRPAGSDGAAAAAAAGETARMARVRVGCVFTDGPATLAAAPSPASIPAVLAISGMPLSHCALGAPLQLPFLLTIRSPLPAMPGAPREVVRSVPLVGLKKAAVDKVADGGSLREAFCLVDPPSEAGGWVCSSCFLHMFGVVCARSIQYHRYLHPTSTQASTLLTHHSHPPQTKTIQA
jgi:hypothetical protein